MPFTDEKKLDELVNEPSDRVFLRKLGEKLYELTENAILKLRIDNIVEKL